MRILLTGSSGLIGRHLIGPLRAEGHEVVRLVRRDGGSLPADAVFFDVGRSDRTALEGFDAVIHLAGENVARRWTKRRKRSILASRADFTAGLCAALARAAKPPGHFLCASGISYYGYDRADPLSEESSTGGGFLAEVTRQWEGVTSVLRGGYHAASPRIALMRIAPVLSTEGGLLAKVLPLFRKGLGAVMGTGRQVMSWISLEDVVGAILHILRTPGLNGAINVASPEAVTNREFSKTLAKVLHRPLLFRIPTPVVKAAFGAMGRETILANQKVLPVKLLTSGFEFGDVGIEETLRGLVR
jgi:uncharacterized protein (TIGR01777 family)